jgi:hypothetical protein
MGDRLNSDDEYARTHILGGLYLNLDDHSFTWILNHIDCFDRQARLNESIRKVRFYGYSGDEQDDEAWEKLGRAIGTLQALETIWVCPNCDDEEHLPISDNWEVLARILSHVRQKVEVKIGRFRPWDAEQSRLFARAIHGHPTITSFVDGDKNFSYESLDSLYSALATLPALELIRLCGSNELTTPVSESALAHPESLTELLRVSTLRSVSFVRFSFTPALCQATANALTDGTAITKLEFKECSFSAKGSAVMMANALGRNTSVSHIKVVSTRDQALFDALATALPSNSTLRRLDLSWEEREADDYDPNLTPVLLALGKNSGIKTVSLDGFVSIDESLCIAMKDGLRMNTTLESLELTCVEVTDDNSDLWCRALSFLRTNKALKYLVVDLEHNVTQSRATAFRTDIVAMIEDNVSLESLSIRKGWTRNGIQAEEYVALITALLHNTTLKSIHFQDDIDSLCLTGDEDKQMAVLLQKNYALETLPDIIQGGDVRALLRLNRAGRRYLVEDGSSISKGVEVLSAVSNVINCVFLHLLENPRLCDRSAVETASGSIGNRGSTRPENHNGKRDREQDQALEEDKGSLRQQT